MNSDNARNYIKNVSTYIININRALKSIKSNIIADFIRLDEKDIIISTNNVANPSNLQEIKRCVKNSLVVEADQIDPPRLSQSKSYLKIVSISYLLWDAWDMNNFYFLFLLFSDFIGILFSFSFLLDDEEACDIAVT